MSEEFGGIESVSGNESVSEVTAEDLVRVREDIKGAVATRSQIKQQGKWDNQNAKLLSLILQYVNDDALLKHVFYYLVDLKTDIVVITALFIPVLQQHITIEPLKPLYHQFWPSDKPVSLNYHDLKAYYAALYDNYDFFTKLDWGVKKQFIADIMRVSWIKEPEKDE